MNATMEMRYEIDINAPLMMREATAMVEGDRYANTIVVTVMDDGVAANLSGCSATAYMIRPDGIKPFVKGTVEGNIVTACLDEGFYEIPGRYNLFIRLTHTDGTKRVLLWLYGWIKGEGNGAVIDPEGAVPDLEDLLAQIDAMEKATQEALDAAAAAAVYGDALYYRAEYGAQIEPNWRLGTLTSAGGSYSSSKQRIITPFLPMRNEFITVADGAKYAVYFYDVEKKYIASIYRPFTGLDTDFSTIDTGNASFFRLVAAYKGDKVIDDVYALAKMVKIVSPVHRYLADAYDSRSNDNHILFTDMELQTGWWNDTGGSLDYEHFHSQKIPVVPGKTYYIGWKLSASTLPCVGARFDLSGNWHGPIMPDDVTQYMYKTADGTGTRTAYAELYCFTVPNDGTRFVSLNLSIGAEREYRNFLSSRPILALSGTGNYEYNETSPVYQAKKGKKLCVFGASGVTIDRLLQAGVYIVGFQEYLVPWYEKVDSYGYWGTGWRNNTATPEESIYYQIVEKQLDLSGYDEFLLIPSTSNFTPDVAGDVDSTNVNQYAGALNAVFDYIYAQVPKAKIYLANAVRKKNYATSESVRANIDAINTLIGNMAAAKSMELIDLAGGSGINQYTQDDYTYDGTHLNNEGNKVQGLYIRKQLVGF